MTRRQIECYEFEVYGMYTTFGVHSPDGPVAKIEIEWEEKGASGTGRLYLLHDADFMWISIYREFELRGMGQIYDEGVWTFWDVIDGLAVLEKKRG